MKNRVTVVSCLFVHDFRSYSKNGEVYTGNLSYEIWNERYIKFFGTVKVLNRTGVLEESDDISRYVKASGPNIEFLNEIDVFTPVSFIVDYWKIKTIVYKYVDESEYVIIRLDSFLGLIAAKRCREVGKKYLIEVVGCIRDSFWNKSLYGKVVAYPLMKIMQKEIKDAPFVVYVTKRFLQSRYPTEGCSTNISNVYLPKQDDNIIERKIEKIKASNYKHFQIVTIGSVSVRYKGQKAVIKALGRLKKKGYMNYTYHLIGIGKQSYLKRVAMKADVNDQIVFHGSMNHDNVIAFLDRCDIYIQPSKQEGLPRALIEGMSRGLLCFGSNIAGIPELLDSKVLFSVGPGNYKEISKMLLKTNRELMLEQGTRNFIEAQNYENDILEHRRESIIRDFMNS